MQVSRRAFTYPSMARWMWIGIANTLLALVPTLVAAAPMSFSVALSGAQQAPPVQTSAGGMANLTYDSSTRNLTWDISVTGTPSAVTMAHVHGPAGMGMDGPPILWLSKKGSDVMGPMTGSATLTEEQAAMLKAGQLYINVHTKDHPKGEIRGQIVAPKG